MLSEEHPVPVPVKKDGKVKTYKYDLVNGTLSKTVEVLKGGKVGDIVELMGKKWKIEKINLQ